MSRLSVEVTLGTPLAARISDTMNAAVAAEIGRVLGELGTERSPAVDLRASDDTSSPIALTIDGRPCRYPDTLAFEALAYAEGTVAVPPDRDAFLERLREL